MIPRWNHSQLPGHRKYLLFSTKRWSRIASCKSRREQRAATNINCLFSWVFIVTCNLKDCLVPRFSLDYFKRQWALIWMLSHQASSRYRVLLETRCVFLSTQWRRSSGLKVLIADCPHSTQLLRPRNVKYLTFGGYSRLHSSILGSWHIITLQVYERRLHYLLNNDIFIDKAENWVCSERYPLGKVWR